MNLRFWLHQAASVGNQYQMCTRNNKMDHWGGQLLDLHHSMFAVTPFGWDGYSNNHCLSPYSHLP